MRVRRAVLHHAKEMPPCVCMRVQHVRAPAGATSTQLVEVNGLFFYTEASKAMRTVLVVGQIRYSTWGRKQYARTGQDVRRRAT